MPIQLFFPKFFIAAAGYSQGGLAAMHGAAAAGPRCSRCWHQGWDDAGKWEAGALYWCRLLGAGPRGSVGQGRPRPYVWRGVAWHDGRGCRRRVPASGSLHAGALRLRDGASRGPRGSRGPAWQLVGSTHTDVAGVTAGIAKPPAPARKCGGSGWGVWLHNSAGGKRGGGHPPPRPWGVQGSGVPLP